MNRPLVSVIVPVFDGARFIKQTLTSVLAQTWSNLEVIVVDDGSSDDSVARIRTFSDARIRLLQTRNGGPARARNLGLDQSSGEFIQFLDHDDLLHPRKIELQVRRLLAEGPDCVACGPWEGFDESAADAQRHPTSLWRDDDPFPWLLSARGGEGFMPTGAWLVPRAIAQRAGPWNEELVRNPDDDGEYFSRVVLDSRRVLFCQEAVFHYRNPGPSNLSQSRTEVSVRSLLSTQHLYAQRLLGIEDTPRVRRSVAYGYATFLETVYPAFPALCREAWTSLSELRIQRYPSSGSRPFLRLSGLVGFPAALRIRHGIRLLFGRPMFNGFFTARSMRRRRVALKRMLAS